MAVCYETVTVVAGESIRKKVFAAEVQKLVEIWKTLGKSDLGKNQDFGNLSCLYLVACLFVCSYVMIFLGCALYLILAMTVFDILGRYTIGEKKGSR